MSLLDINNPGFAFVVNSILTGNKNAKLLSKAKKESDTKQIETSDNFPELIGEDGQVVPQVFPMDTEQNKRKKKRIKLSKLNRYQIESIGRTKPKLEDKEMEKRLTMIATKGVVQLFNVVKEQQKQIKQKLDEVGISNNKKTKILERFNEDNLFKKVNEKNTKVNHKVNTL